MHNREETTLLFLQAREGDTAALHALLPHVYEELYQLAKQHQLRHFGKRLLDTTAVVHEVYLKLVDQKKVQVNDKRHFMALSARMVRQVLIDEARKRGRKKRGGDYVLVSLDNLEVPLEERSALLLAVDEALEHLAQHHARMAQIVEYRFFAGMTTTEIADVLSTSERTVAREWRRARAYLHHALTTSDDVDRTSPSDT